MGRAKLTRGRLEMKTCPMLILLAAVAGRSPPGLAVARNGTKDVRDNCANCVILSSTGDSTVERYPWLFNAAKFYYYRSHDDGYRSYQWQGKINGENNILYLHFYDEGFLYDGFWVVNYDEDDYHNDWNNYVYTSEFHDCPEDTGKKWYIWDGDYWVSLVGDSKRQRYGAASLLKYGPWRNTDMSTGQPQIWSTVPNR